MSSHYLKVSVLFHQYTVFSIIEILESVKYLQILKYHHFPNDNAFFWWVFLWNTHMVLICNFGTQYSYDFNPSPWYIDKRFSWYQNGWLDEQTTSTQSFVYQITQHILISRHHPKMSKTNLSEWNQISVQHIQGRPSVKVMHCVYYNITATVFLFYFDIHFCVH